MAKVAIIGAGSIVFCKTLMLDILATDGLEDTEFALMAPSTSRTSQVESFAKRVIEANDLPSTVWDLPFLDETAKRNILGYNAANLFGLEVPQKYRRQMEAAE